MQDNQPYFDELVCHLWSHVDAFDIKISGLAMFSLGSKGIRFGKVILSSLLPFAFRPFLRRKWSAIKNNVGLYFVVAQ